MDEEENRINKPEKETEELAPKKETEELTPKKETLEIKLLSQGTYGCIFKPELKCDSGEPGDIRYVSKIQKNTETIKNEIIIGEAVKKINNYEFFFSPIETICPVSISKINNSVQQKCDIISKEGVSVPVDSKYISAKIRYVSKMNIEEYLLTLPREPELLSKKIIASYLYLLTSIQKLRELGIIHYDIKEKNIMYDESNHSPIIIDFGLSFIATSLTTPELQNQALYTPIFYPYWRIDIFILSYITKIVRSPQKEGIPIVDMNVTQEKITELINNYIQKLSEFNIKHSILITDGEFTLMKTTFTEFFSKYIGNTWEKVFEDLFKPEIYSTWDLYSSAITFLLIIRSTGAYKFETPSTQKMIEVLKSLIMATPDKCKSIETVREEISFSG